MDLKKKIILFSIYFVSILLAFATGVLIGTKTKVFKKYKTKNDKYISFFSVKKHLGEETSKKEKQAMRMFIIPYEECFRNELSDEERNIVKDIQNEVMAMSQNNEKIKFKINELETVKNNDGAKKAVSKTRKCQKQAYKHMTKTDKRLFKSALSKLSINNVIAIFHGIR